MKVYTIFTGGTIGSITTSGIISNSQEMQYTLLQMYRDKYPEDNTSFVSLSPYTLLSENLDGTYIALLIKAVRQTLTDPDANGIIITHGTDTLQYSSACLGYVFHNVKIPILLVSSAYVLKDKRNNGLINFSNAMEYIREGGTPGVYVSYVNCNKLTSISVPPCNKTCIHPALRLQSALFYSDSVYSIPNNVFPENKAGESIYDFSSISEVMLTKFTPYILRLHIYPGFTYPQNLDGIKVILLEGYHSGTLCINQELKDFAKKAQNKNIPIYLSGLDGKADIYETVTEYKKTGIIPLCGIMPISLFCKCWLYISNQLPITYPEIY